MGKRIPQSQSLPEFLHPSMKPMTKRIEIQNVSVDNYHHIIIFVWQWDYTYICYSPLDSAALNCILNSQFPIPNILPENVDVLWKAAPELSDGRSDLCFPASQQLLAKITQTVTEGLCPCQQQYCVGKLLIYRCLEFKLMCNCDVGSMKQVFPSCNI